MALHTLRCAVCAEPFEAARLDAETCSARCRNRRHRAHRRAEAERRAIETGREVARAAALLASVAHLLDDTARADAARLSAVLRHAD